MSKLFERMMMKKIEGRIQAATPELQQGGQPGGSTIDHLVKAMTVMKMQMKKGKVTIITLMDIVKCFDKCKLNEIMYELGQAGIHGRQLRLFEAFNEDTVIKIQGDVDSEREAVIKNSVGQGTTGAVQGSALMMARAIDNNFKNNKNKIKIGEEEVGPSGFVDDMQGLSGDIKGAKETGESFTRAIEELSLKAHPEKTVNIVVGAKAKREKMKGKLAADPMKLQGFEVRTVPRDVYLGMTLSEGGPSDSIDQNIEAKRAKAIIKTRQAKMLLRDPRILQVGWIDTARALYLQTILPTFTYSSIAWIKMSKRQKASVEAIQKHCIYELMELLPTAKYSAVLLELGITRVEHFMNQLKINYVGQLVERKPNSEVVKILKEEEKEYPGQGLLGEVRELCEKYQVPSVLENAVDPEWVKKEVSWRGMFELWEETRKSPKVPLQLRFTNKRKYYFDKPKFEAKLIFYYYVGELNLRTSRPRDSAIKFGGVQCLAGVCCGEDSIPHIRECFGYDTKAPSNFRDEDLGDFLLKIHRERVRRWSAPLIPADVSSLLDS